MTTLFLLCILVPFFLHIVVDLLNLRHSRKQPIPTDFVGLIDEEKFIASKRYHDENTRFSVISSSISTGISVVFLARGGFGWLERATVADLPTPWQSLLYFLVLGALSSLVSLPFSYYHTFHIEQKYGFNRTTLGTFVGDRIKGWVLAILLGGALLYVLSEIYARLGVNAWIYAWIFFCVVQTVILFVAPVLLMPIFNKFLPLAPGPLRDDIEAFAREQHLPLQGIFSMDGSKRSAKANAFFTGFGKLRRIVLFDTLMQKFSNEEVVSVLAHEIGHLKLGHVWKQMVLSFAVTLLMFWALFQIMGSDALSAALGFGTKSFHSGLLATMLLFGPISFLTSLVTSALSRRYEFQADAFAKRTVGNPDHLIAALKKLSVDHLSNLSPHPWKVWLEYSHPPVTQRIAALRNS